MIEEFKLELEERSELGKQANNRLRAQGRIPGIYYSAEGSATPFHIDGKHLLRAFQSKARIYSVSVGGKKHHAIFKDIQHHPVTDNILHIDLYGIQLEDKIEIEVPIQLQGEAVGVKTGGGVLTQNLTKLKVRCLATDIPDAIHIEVSHLELGKSIHVSDLKLENIEILIGKEATIVSVLSPKTQLEEAVPAVSEEAEEGVTEAEGKEVKKETASEKGQPSGKQGSAE